MRTKISTAITVNLALVDDSGAPVTAWTYAAGDVKILAPGATAWANPAATPTQTTLGGSRGDWQIALTGAEVGATPGELLVLVYKSGVIAMRRRAIEVDAAAPGEVTSIGSNAITATSIASNAITSAKIADDAITAAKIATGAIDADAIADGAIDAGAIADGSITAAKLAGNAITSAKIASGAITAAAFATDAIDSNAIAATAVTELQSGLATASALQSVQDDTNDLQARLPAALVGGRIDASVGAMAAGVVTAAAVATGAIDADAIASDAATEIATAVDAALTAEHGGGSWQAGSGGADAATIAAAVVDQALAGHTSAGTVGAALSDIATRVAAVMPAWFLDDNVTRNGSGLPTSARRRFYASAAHLAAATAGGGLTGNEVATVTMTWTYSADLLTAQRGAA